MSTPKVSPTQATLDTLFAAERETRRLHLELANVPTAAILPLYKANVASALALEDEDEKALRLARMSRLLGELEGADAVDLLIDILGSDDPEGRHTAGEALEDIAFDRFKEVALGVERALVRLPNGSPALTELPYLLAEVAEPGSTKLLAKFLQHNDAEAVASAIEALVEVGDPSASPLLKPLEKDARQVQLDDESDERVTIGDLATEARELFADLEAPPRGSAAGQAARQGGGGGGGGHGGGHRSPRR